MKRVIKLKYYKQLNDDDCGPACLRMVLSFFGKSLTEQQLTKQLRTSARYGTSDKQLVNIVRKLGFFCYSFGNSNLEKIKYFINLGLPVIVNYIESSNNEGHFAVVTGYDSKNLILNDPYNGKNFKMKSKDFVKRWRGGYQDKNIKKWMMVVSDKMLDTI